MNFETVVRLHRLRLNLGLHPVPVPRNGFEDFVGIFARLHHRFIVMRYVIFSGGFRSSRPRRPLRHLMAEAEHVRAFLHALYLVEGTTTIPIVTVVS